MTGLDEIQIPEEPLTGDARFIHDWCEGEDLVLIKELRARDFLDPDIREILLVLSNVCPHCWDNLRPCSCWNDE